MNKYETEDFVVAVIGIATYIIFGTILSSFIQPGVGIWNWQTIFTFIVIIFITWYTRRVKNVGKDDKKDDYCLYLFIGRLKLDYRKSNG